MNMDTDNNQEDLFQVIGKVMNLFMILIPILEFLQDHDAVLITTESDLRYELYIKGLEKHFLRRAAQKGLRLPW